ncbi:hypothetical protein B0H14DRAFT_3490470 [Mycena olivaceomarginata]|nr:hypothetical protein B0H14DRAFT_3490470 [Mycena olivaceomarginata]
MSRSTIHDSLDPTPPSLAMPPSLWTRPPRCAPSLGLFPSTIPSSWPPGPPPQAPPLPPPPPLQLPDHVTRSAEYNVRLAKGTKLSVLYRYQPGVPVEYTESGLGALSAILLPMTPGTRLPWVDFAYSCGAPDGGCAKQMFSSPIYWSTRTASPSRAKSAIAHAKVSRRVRSPTLTNSVGRLTGTLQPRAQDVQGRLAAAREARQRLSSPQRDIFLHTSAYISADWSCSTTSESKSWPSTSGAATARPRDAPGRSFITSTQDPIHKKRLPPARISAASITPTRTPDHWSDFGIQDGTYDVDYIAAHFTDDSEELARTLRNHTAQTLHCPIDHCVDGRLAQVELFHIDLRRQIPASGSPPIFKSAHSLLFTSQGVHRHPIPLPEKNPAGPALADPAAPPYSLPRSSRHDPAALSFFAILPSSRFYPGLPRPPTATLTTLHPSLANCAHLAVYIAQVREEHFPHGTDWKGLCSTLSFPYPARLTPPISSISTTPPLRPHDEDDEPAPPANSDPDGHLLHVPGLRARLKKAQYLQSDIGFKRVIKYDEFEIVSSSVVCTSRVTRPLLTSSYSVKSIKLCTTTPGGNSIGDTCMDAIPKIFSVGLVLHWGADQHRGQAKGLGLHLVERAAALPADRMDMHEPERSLRSLGPYDHPPPFPEHVRQLMRSLACIRHADWQGAIDQILRDGGKPAKGPSLLYPVNWFNDKESCCFAFPGICWERSFIPLPVWQAGEPNTNLVETVHRDTNRDGVHCTLVGGLLRRQDYDEMQRATLAMSPHLPSSPLAKTRQEYEVHGIRPSYDAVTPVTNALKNVIRRSNGRTKKLQTTALAVSTHNSNIHCCHQNLTQALADFDNLCRVLTAPHLQNSSAQAALKQEIASATQHARKAATHTTVRYASVTRCVQAAAGNSASTGPIMNFAPAHILPTSPAVHCAPGRCDICDGQFLAVTYQANSLNGPQTAPLPHWRTCRPAYRPDHPSIDVQTHSLEAASKFFVVCPGREEGIYTSATAACVQTEGIRNSRHEAVATFAEAKALWALSCLRCHGHECRCERLARLDARGVHWAVKGFEQICGSRGAAFRLAEDEDLHDI